MHPVASFPFASDLDKSVCLAALLSAVVRPTIPTCPGFGIDASIQAAGKTLLAKATAELSIGRPAPVFPHSDTRGRGADEEIKKTILAALLADYRTLIWDNVLGIFDNAAIASLLTSPVIEGRILGQSKMAKADNRLLFLMTGNNLHLTGDMPRRVLVCRLIPETDRPYARSFDLDPLEYVRNNRQRLVAAALTIIRGWFASTDYLVDKTAPGRMASFESWDDLVRQPVAWLSRTYPELGLVDVMEAVDAAQTVDPELHSLGELWEQLYLKYGKNFFTAKDLFNLDFSDPQIHDLLCEVAGKELTSSQSIGLVLNYRRDRIAKGYRLKQYINTKGHQYKVEKVKSN